MATARREPKEETRKLDDLLPHPSQLTYFQPLTQFDLQALADDIKINGLRQQIEILPKNKAGLPPNTIIDGHQRKRALVLLGETQARVIVRHDLAQADAATVEQAFLQPNQNRRQLDPLAKARVVLRLFEIEKDRPRGDLARHQLPEARDRVGAAIGMSGRNLNRYFRVLKTPVPIQDAFRAGTLSLVMAEKVSDLDAKKQREVSDRIQSGEVPKCVVTEYLTPSSRSASNAVGMFCRHLKRALDSNLDERIDEIPEKTLAYVRPRLEQAADTIQRLLERARSVEPNNQPHDDAP